MKLLKIVYNINIINHAQSKKKIIMTSYFQIFKLWRPIAAQELIFIKICDISKYESPTFLQQIQIQLFKVTYIFTNFFVTNFALSDDVIR